MVIVLGFTGILGELISIKSIDLVFYRMLFSFIALFIFLSFRKEIFNISKRKAVELYLLEWWLLFIGFSSFNPLKYQFLLQ